ncbi:MAG: mannose-1-phosphate guanylyltransferase [Bacillota bacterium]
MPFAIIMAGGRGERFWPRSREAMPKQFLSLVEERTMLQLTLARLEGLVDLSDIYIVTGREFKDIVLKQIPDLPSNNIIIEPFGRDTAAAIGLAATHLCRKNPHEVMVVLPADHYISDASRFQAVLKGAITAAWRAESIVTLGVTPNRPETGYGYILRGDLQDTFAGVSAYHAARFVEKPDYQKAREYLSSGRYLWNSGMFIWRVDLINKLIGKHLPGLAKGLEEIGEVLNSDRYEEILEKVYLMLPKVSVDYGIMERAENVLVIPGDFGWDDIGSWTALERFSQKDQHGNVLNGRGVFLNTNNTLVFCPGKTVALLGVENLLVVDEGDSLLISHRDRVQEIKKVVQTLRESGLGEVL